MNSWGYLSGLLRAEKVHDLTNNTFSLLAETLDTDSFMKSLEDTKYGVLFRGQNLSKFSELFDEYYQYKFQAMADVSPCPIVFRIHTLKTDLNNLKLCYKAKVSQKTVSWENLSEKGTISPERMFSIVEQELWNEFPSVISQTLINLSSVSKDSLRQIDFLLDRAYYTYRIEILQEAASYEWDLYKILLDFYKKEVDCENIKNIFRAKTMHLERKQIADIMISGGYLSADYFIDHVNGSTEEIADLVKNSSYGEIFTLGIAQWLGEQSCSLLEKQIDEYLLDLVSNFTYQSFGPAVIEEALRSLQIEIKNLKLIIIGKLNNMSVTDIKERVRNV
ncbi:MAG: V-type ATPase subunit [Brevinema sp.]